MSFFRGKGDEEKTRRSRKKEKRIHKRFQGKKCPSGDRFAITAAHACMDFYLHVVFLHTMQTYKKGFFVCMCVHFLLKENGLCIWKQDQQVVLV